MRQCKVFVLFLTEVLLLVTRDGVDGALTIKPVNIITVTGQTARLVCSSNSNQTVYWRRSYANSDHEHWLYYGRHGFNGNNVDGRYRIDKNESTGRYDVIISNAQPKDAGKYTCIDESGLGEEVSGELIISGRLECEADIPKDGVMGYNVFGIEQDLISMSCGLPYTGNIAPSLKWSWPGSETKGEEPMVIKNASFIKSTLKLSVEKKYNNARVTCQATVSTDGDPPSIHSQEELQWESEPIVVKYAEFESRGVEECPGMTLNLFCNPSCSNRLEELTDDTCRCHYTYIDPKDQRRYSHTSDLAACRPLHQAEQNKDNLHLIVIAVLASLCACLIAGSIVYIKRRKSMKDRVFMDAEPKKEQPITYLLS